MLVSRTNESTLAVTGGVMPSDGNVECRCDLEGYGELRDGRLGLVDETRAGGVGAIDGVGGVAGKVNGLGYWRRSVEWAVGEVEAG